MEKKPVRGVVFDLGWTLCRPATGDWMIPLEWMVRVNRTAWEALSAERRKSVFRQATERINRDHLLFGQEDEFVRFRRFYSELARELPELELTADDVEKITCDKVYNDGNMIFADDVYETVRLLKTRFRVGVLSDTWPSTERIMRAQGLWDVFDGIVFSCYEGVFKPDPKMYARIQAELGLPPEQLLMIDDLPKNLNGALNCGMQAAQARIYPSARPADGFAAVNGLPELTRTLLENGGLA